MWGDALELPSQECHCPLLASMNPLRDHTVNIPSIQQSPCLTAQPHLLKLSTDPCAFMQLNAQYPEAFFCKFLSCSFLTGNICSECKHCKPCQILPMFLKLIAKPALVLLPKLLLHISHPPPFYLDL
ncbi:hypothetical protein AB205_0152800 [Aquarana catesbeiana]|uniref:Uncharacterized protein n=1 Tax=Aquarana catesbeiana TaxID=8400 RepID=A0A2G9RA79_AQUCT|nr:hypothetical protein AB205_0152800 [Aquarana catesbeiana]